MRNVLAARILNDHSPDLYEFAEAAATEAKAVYRCANHNDVLLTRGDAEANNRAYAIASNRANDHGLDVNAVRKGVTDVLNDAVSDCPYPPCA
jgi:hypothetical protein